MCSMRPAAVEAPRQPGRFGSLFRTATSLGSSMMRRTLPEAPAPVQHHAAPSVRMEPSVGAPAAAAPARPAPRPAPQHQDEMGLEIPTFLRRQSN